MLRNLPRGVTQPVLLELLNSNGFAQGYDFVYVPHNFATATLCGFAFINFVDDDTAERFFDDFAIFVGWPNEGNDVPTVEWSTNLQGQAAQMERYRNSPTMHSSVPEEMKPSLFRDGVRVAFPAPTKAIAAPKCRSLGQCKSTIRN